MIIKIYQKYKIFFHTCQIVVSSLRNTPKPGYSLKHRENGVESPFTEKYLEKTQSAEFGSKRSDGK
mgnify:FL=1